MKSLSFLLQTFTTRLFLSTGSESVWPALECVKKVGCIELSSTCQLDFPLSGSHIPAQTAATYKRARRKFNQRVARVSVCSTTVTQVLHDLAKPHVQGGTGGCRHLLFVDDSALSCVGDHVRYTRHSFSWSFASFLT